MKKIRAKIKEIAERRIKKLFELAKKEAAERPELAKKYIHYARLIARKTQTKIPKQLRRNFCKKCDMPFTTATKVRTRKGFLVKECICGAKRRFKIKIS